MRRGLLLAAAAAATTVMACADEALAQSKIFSWESGTVERWHDTSWSSPDWTDRSITSFGATDGNLAYGFKGAGAFNFGDEVEFVATGASWATAEDQAKWAALTNGNLLLMDFTVQGERAQPLDPNAANYTAFWLFWNAPSPATNNGNVGSYNNPVDPESGAVAQYQVVFATEYFTDARTRTMAWDYKAAGFHPELLVPTENPPGSGSWQQHYSLFNISQNGRVAGVQSAIDNMRAYRALDTDPTYNGGSAGGTWSTAGNWANGVPNAQGAIAVLKAIPEVTGVGLNLSSNVTLGSLVLNNIQRTNLGTPIEAAPTAYNIGGTGTLTMDNGANEASIVVLGGSNTITAPINLLTNTVIDLAADTTTGNVQGVPTTSAGLTVNNITLAAGKTLRTTSVGMLSVNGNIAGGAGSAVNFSGPVALVGGNRVITTGALALGANASLDIGNGAILVDYASDATTSPFADLAAEIAAGYAGGLWNGKGINSSVAAGGGGSSGVGIVSSADLPALVGTTFRGQLVDASSILIAYALRGDTNVSGSVDFDDLLALAQNYGTNSGANWGRGDTNYDGAVNFDDLLALSQNYGSAASFEADWALARSLVPEPGTLALLSGIASMTLGRRRNRA